MKNKQKEWHHATKPLERSGARSWSTLKQLKIGRQRREIRTHFLSVSKETDFIPTEYCTQISYQK
jgi:hypothetical protein